MTEEKADYKGRETVPENLNDNLDRVSAGELESAYRRAVDYCIKMFEREDLLPMLRLIAAVGVILARDLGEIDDSLIAGLNLEEDA